MSASAKSTPPRTLHVIRIDVLLWSLGGFGDEPSVSLKRAWLPVEDAALIAFYRENSDGGSLIWGSSSTLPRLLPGRALHSIFQRVACLRRMGRMRPALVHGPPRRNRTAAEIRAAEA